MRTVWRVGLLSIFLSAGCPGCVGRVALPTVAVHGVTWLQQRAASDRSQQRGRDYALTVQLAFATFGRSTRPRHETLLQPSAAYAPIDPGSCEQAALCEWAWLSEESTLTALGVAP